MTKSQIKSTLAEANKVEPWDNGIGDTSAARRPASEAASDFVFNQPSESVGQGRPESAATPTPAPLPPTQTETATELSQAATPPQMKATSPRKLVPAPMLHCSKEQPGLKDCSPTERQRFEATGFWPGAAPERDPSHSNPFIRTVLKSPTVKAALATAKAHQKAFKKVVADTNHLTDITPQKNAIRLAIESATDIAEITKLRSDAALLDSPEAETARQAASRFVAMAHVKMEASLRVLVDVVLVELENQVPEIESAEVELFDKFGFAHCSTPLMGKLRAIQARVRQHSDFLDMRKSPEHSRAIVGDGSQIIDTFED